MNSLAVSIAIKHLQPCSIIHFLLHACYCCHLQSSSAAFAMPVHVALAMRSENVLNAPDMQLEA